MHGRATCREQRRGRDGEGQRKFPADADAESSFVSAPASTR